MKATVVTYLGLVSYLTLLAVPMVLFDIESFVAITLLLGLPVVWLVRRLDVSKQYIVLTFVVSLIFAVAWQLIGHATGAWYELSELSWRLLGVVPLESLWYTFVTFSFYIFSYEYFIDDKQVDLIDWSQQKINLVIGLFSVLVGCLLLVFLDIFIPFAYAVVLTLLLISLGVLPLLLRGQQSLVLEKVLLAVLVLLPFICIVEMVGLLNTYWVFAFESQYLWSLQLLGETVPLEKLVSLILVPVWVLLLHEWFFDDAA